ncbi:hypothetical protein ACFV9E_11745 [Streptomyces sp. NPDC059835]|uniref:hypothetical protein n=1 Tax=Streptomyces sp. NPDC059835 TaxID=3346967 RepID=UPI00364E1F2C
MTAGEAFELHNAMRQYGIPGSVTPADPDDLEGKWLVVDADGQDITAHALTRATVARNRRPERGFVIAR